MIDRFIEWFSSRPKYERVLFIIDVVLLVVLLCAWNALGSSYVSSAGEVIL